MQDAGGYWRPLAAVARLLEELGELAELLEDPGAHGDELAGELADLWIITTALADQFLIEVPDPECGARDASVTAGALVIAAGPIGRVINYYDGPKTPRTGDRLPSLTDAVGHFHTQLELLAGALGVDLAAAVRAKITVIRGRDMKRFSRGGYDPSTAPVLALVTEGPERKLWGSPELDLAADASEQATVLAPSLCAFARAAGPEGLEGYVIRAPAPRGSATLDAWLDGLLEALRGIEPGWIHTGSSSFGLGPAIDVLPGPDGTALILLGTAGMCPSPGGDRPRALDDGAVIETQDRHESPLRAPRE